MPSTTAPPIVRTSPSARMARATWAPNAPSRRSSGSCLLDGADHRGKAAHGALGAVRGDLDIALALHEQVPPKSSAPRSLSTGSDSPVRIDFVDGDALARGERAIRRDAVPASTRTRSRARGLHQDSTRAPSAPPTDERHGERLSRVRASWPWPPVDAEPGVEGKDQPDGDGTRQAVDRHSVEP